MSFVIPLESNPDVSIRKCNFKKRFLKVFFFYLLSGYFLMINQININTSIQVLNKFMKKCGVSEKYQLVDVYGLDQEMLAMLPPKVKAFILLFPCTENYEAHRAQEDEELKGKQNINPDLFYMRQYLHSNYLPYPIGVF